MKLDKFDKYLIITVLTSIVYILVKKIIPFDFHYLAGLLVGTIYSINISHIKKWIHS